MTDDRTIKDTIKALEQQETAILDEFQRLEVRLSQIRTAKSALVALENEEPMEFDGKLADACRVVLQSVGKRSLTPIEVRDAVKALGYDVAQHDNQMAAVHSVLKRLAESGEVKTKELKQVPGQRRYYWAASFAPPASAKGPDTSPRSIIEAISAALEATNAIVQQSHAARARAYHRVTLPGVSNSILPSGGSLPITVKETASAEKGTLPVTPKEKK